MEHEIIKQEREISALKSDVSAVKEQVKTLFTHVDRQDKLIETVNNLALALQKVVDAQGQINEKVDNLCSDMATIKNKPAKRMEGIVDKIVLTAIGILVGAFFAALGIK